MAFGSVFTQSEVSRVCILCGSVEHDHIDCPHPKAKEVKDMYNILRMIIERGIEESGSIREEETNQRRKTKEKFPMMCLCMRRTTKRFPVK